ncbi:MAG: HD domain-containing protein [Clostridia bacterium]|nr:HD domain-containing protein [Clostridia bacterium]
MIDFIKAQEMFKKYLKQYDTNDGNIELKIKHTYEVVKKSEYISKGLGLDKENIELAKLIALLHDIGRFEQVKQINDFLDSKSFDHAEYGIKVLFKDNLIREFIEDIKYDNIIQKAIYNHNKYKIEEGLNESELLHSKIIRDADKLDNFRVKEKENFENIFPSKYNPKTINYETVSPKVYKDFMNHQCIKLEDRETQIDFWVCVIAFIFDLNFDISLQYIKDKNYIDILVDRIEYKNKETKEQMEQIRQCAKEYLERRCINE